MLLAAALRSRQRVLRRAN